ncbi:uncharacterized protein STEHIDRAFT_148296, partial [Stereum hirsutum FP-91666 SS1]|uniref:uncharacterized protein n=1 Tax=Stereum hirsutum (strain FP-91666) TaxID=721885 RepID=UPI0004449677
MYTIIGAEVTVCRVVRRFLIFRSSVAASVRAGEHFKSYRKLQPNYRRSAPAASTPDATTSPTASFQIGHGYRRARTTYNIR